MRYLFALIALLVSALVSAPCHAIDIKVKRGTDATLPATFGMGVPAMTTDTHRVFMGYSTGKVELARTTDVATAAQGATVDKTTADEVYATDYNGGALTSATINAAITAIGSAAKTLVIAPGAWTFDASVTVPSNLTLKIQPGCVLTRTSGTLTVNGPLSAPNAKWLVAFATGTWNTYFRMPTTQDVRSIWFNFAGNGATDDYLPMCAFLQSGNKGKRILEPLTYWVNNQVATIDSNFELVANGSTVKSEMTELPLNFGVQKAYTTGLNVSVSKNVNHFTIPGGVTLSVGDLVNLKSTTPYTTNYSYGVLTNVVAITGGEAYIDVLPEATFTADALRTYYPSDNIKITGLKVDNSATTVTTHGISITGRNIELRGLEFLGAPNAGIGLTLTAIGAQVFNVRAKDYQNRSGAASGAHYGDGAVLYGHNILLTGSTITNCKHDVSMSSPDFISSNIKLADSTFTQAASDFGLTVTGTFGTDSKIHGAVDTHPSLNGLTIDNCTIASAGMVGAIYIRSGNARIAHSKITWLNTSNAAGGVIGIAETQLSDLHLSDNTIAAGVSGSPLVTDYVGTVGIATGAVKYNNNALSNVTWGSVTNPLSNLVDNSAYDATAWNGDTTHAPSKDAVRDKFESLSSATLQTNGTNNTSQTVLNLKAGTNMTLTPDGAGGVTFDATSGSTGAPSAATYIVQTTTNQPTNAQVLSSLGTGVLQNTTGTGVLSILGVGTGNNNLVQLNGSAQLPAVSGALLTNLPNQLSQSTITLAATSTSTQNPITITPPAHDFAVAQAYSSLNFNPFNGTASPIAGSSWRGFNVSPNYNGTGTLPELDAIFLNPRNNNTGTITSLNGVVTWLRNINASGVVSLMKGIYVKAPTNAGTVYGVDGIHIENQGLSTASTTYGILIDDQNTSTNPYAIYTGTGKVRFGDNVTAKSYGDTVKANGTCSTSINIDPTLGGIHTLTLSGACAIGVTNLAAGQSFSLEMAQGTTAPVFQTNSACTASTTPFACCTGNGTGTCPYKFPAGTPPVWANNATNLLSCEANGAGTALLCNGMTDVR